jgi:hypothetical protein
LTFLIPRKSRIIIPARSRMRVSDKVLIQLVSMAKKLSAQPPAHPVCPHTNHGIRDDKVTSTDLMVVGNVSDMSVTCLLTRDFLEKLGRHLNHVSDNVSAMLLTSTSNHLLTSQRCQPSATAISHQPTSINKHESQTLYHVDL